MTRKIKPIMRVYNLACANAHTFEGWFSSAEDFLGQQARGVLTCPICDSPKIEKRLHAPAVVRRNTLGNAATPEVASGGAANAPTTESSDLAVSQMRAIVENPAIASEDKMDAMRAVMRQHIRKTTEDVGDAFVGQVRAMHREEIPQRNVRGRASVADAIELIEDGINVMPIPFAVDSSELH